MAEATRLTLRNPLPAPLPGPPPGPALRPAPAALPLPEQRLTSPPRPETLPARLRPRHLGLIAGFVLAVLLPTLAAALYLWLRAEDQFASTLAFTVRSADGTAEAAMLGGLGRSFGGAPGSGDGEVLYEFIRSQDMVQLIDARLDLAARFARPRDPLLSYRPGGSIEDLTDYWRRMVRVSLDSTTGLLELRVRAFTARDAQTIARAIEAESTRRINAMSEAAREDAVRYARDDLARAEARVQNARAEMTAFRIRNRIVDAGADVSGQMGVVQMLEQQLAQAMVDLDLLARHAPAGDPRLTQGQNRIAVIEARLAAERARFGAGGDYGQVMADYERLTVDREFAERSYVAARAQFDTALAEANRKSRYLAAYIHPTLAEVARFPERGLIVFLIALFGFLGWSILSLIFYSFRDRR